MASIGIDLAAGRAGGLLRFHAARPTSGGLESHLATLANLVRGFDPRLVVIDPITAFDLSADDERVKLMLVRAGDLFKSKGITSLFTALTQGTEAPESTSIGISSLVDVWILLRNLELAGERTRGLYILKARGMAHSNQIREFRLSESGIKLVEVLLDADGRVLTGSARSFHENQKASEAEERRAEEERRHATLDTRRRVIEAKIAALRAEYEEELESLEAESQRQGTLVRRADRAFAELATRRSDFGPAEAARKGTP
jgi:circadian clock protein KaiC